MIGFNTGGCRKTRTTEKTGACHKKGAEGKAQDMGLSPDKEAGGRAIAWGCCGTRFCPSACRRQRS